MKKKILIIEDEEKIARFIELELSHEGYDIDKAFNGRQDRNGRIRSFRSCAA